MSDVTREQWLNDLARALVPFLKDTNCPPLDIKFRPDNAPSGPPRYADAAGGRWLIYMSRSVNTSIEVLDQILGRVVFAVGETHLGDPDLLVFKHVFEQGCQIEAILTKLGPYPEK